MVHGKWDKYTGFLPDSVGALGGAQPCPFSSAPCYPSAAGTGDSSWDPFAGAVRETPGFLPERWPPSWEIAGTGHRAWGSFCPRLPSPTPTPTHTHTWADCGSGWVSGSSKMNLKAHTSSSLAQLFQRKQFFLDVAVSEELGPSTWWPLV